MRKTVSILSLTLVAILVFSFLYFTNNLSKTMVSDFNNKSFTVVIDPGHGGEDGGAIAYDNTLEKDINLQISLKLKNLLNLYGVDVIMTRTEDCSIYNENCKNLRQKKISDIHNRFKIMEDNSDALFVSIHQNKFESESQNGAQIFYSKNTASSKKLAEKIQRSIAENLQPENKRVVKPTGTEIYLLYHAKSTAVLVECGFISNKTELEKLKTEEYQTSLAMSIADGILKYKQEGEVNGTES